MKITLLGTGDAIGTPKIGCTCPQCTRGHSTGETRLRTSLLIEAGDRHILVDTSPDLRLQLLKYGSPRIDAVLWTHGHYDHFIGYGEFYRVQKLPPVYAPPPVIEYISQFFDFLSFTKCPVPAYEPFTLFGVELTFIEMNHPPMYTCGLLISGDSWKVGYTSDTRSDIPDRSLRILKGVDLLLVDSLAPPGYHIQKHMNYQDARDLASRLGARMFRCVHASHSIPWDTPDLGRDGDCFLPGSGQPG
jgi:phosphoribosyl 1,2-cyclic phosphate phosphodiesterase